MVVLVEYKNGGRRWKNGGVIKNRIDSVLVAGERADPLQGLGHLDWPGSSACLPRTFAQSKADVLKRCRRRQNFVPDFVCTSKIRRAKMLAAEVKDELIVVVTGGRDFKDKTFVYETLSQLRAYARYRLTIVEGGCPTGVDLFVRKWCGWETYAKKTHYLEHITVPADWGTYGRSAGPIRNRRMLEEYEPDFVIAFEGGKGTASCVEIARQLKIPVKKLRKE